MNRGTLATRIALALLWCAPAAMAASVCDGPCSVSMAFPAGGSISAPDGATITFGPEGGLLALGDGGSLDLGPGGGITPLEGGLPDMSQGGTVQLGPGGAITFGNGGSLATGGQGGISFPDGSAFDVEASGPVTVDSEGKAFIGDVDIGGEINYTAGGSITLEDPAFVGFNVHGTGVDSDVTVTSGGDLRTGVVGASTVSLTASGPADGGAAGGSGAGSGVCLISGAGESDGCDPMLFGSGGLVIQPITLDPGTTSAEVNVLRVSNSDNAAGSMGWMGLLVGLAALGRRRR